MTSCNYPSYLTSTSAQNLYKYCCEYIESAHKGGGEMTANEDIYNMCAEYILSGAYSDKLKAIFKMN